MTSANRERVWIPGPVGRLAGELCYGNGTRRATALLLCPHPYMGGRMRLPLMTRLAEALAQRDIASLRFDYGGVGESEGPKVGIGSAMQQFWSTGAAPDDPVHVQEAEAARTWLAANVGGPITLIGYSYGAYVATTLHNAGTPAIVMVAPTVARHDYAHFRNESTPTLVLYGDGDFATGEGEMQAWINCLTGPTQVRHFKAGDHFFRGIEADVALAAAEFIERTCCSPQEASR